MTTAAIIINNRNFTIIGLFGKCRDISYNSVTYNFALNLHMININKMYYCIKTRLYAHYFICTRFQTR